MITYNREPDLHYGAKGIMAFEAESDNGSARYLDVEVEVEDSLESDTWAFAYSFRLALDGDGRAEFRIDDRVRAFMAYQLPDPNDLDTQVMTSPARRYRLKHAEVEDGHNEYLESFYHNDKSGGSPYMVDFVLEDAMDNAYDYLIVAETKDRALVENITLKLGASTINAALANTVLKGTEVHWPVDPGIDYDTISVPANLTVRIYKNTPTVVTGAAKYTLLGLLSSTVLYEIFDDTFDITFN